MGFREYLSAIKTSDGSVALPITGHKAITSHNSYPDPISKSILVFGQPYTGTVGLYYGLAFAPTANADGSYTLYAAQGPNNSIAVVKLGTDGSLAQTGTIVMRRGDFPAGLAADAAGRLYVAVNQYDAGDNNTTINPGSFVVYNPAITGVVTPAGTRARGSASEVVRVKFTGPEDTFGTVIVPSTTRPGPPASSRSRPATSPTRSPPWRTAPRRSSAASATARSTRST